MFTVKCFTPRETLYECLVEVSSDAIVTAHLLAETYDTNCRCNVYKQGETNHFYSVNSNMDVTDRILHRFT